jgi:hypothetical protein
MEEVLLNKSGTIKKIQEKKTKDIKEYMKTYFQTSEDITCDICNCKYKRTSHRRHIVGKYHKLVTKINELTLKQLV